MSRNQFCFSTVAVALVLNLLCLSHLQAQQEVAHDKWVINAGAQLVKIDTAGIHIDEPNLNKLTYQGLVSTTANLPKGKPWQITFDLKFGQLRSAGSGICLFDGNNVVGWVGADGWYKKMGCFVGKDNGVAGPDANTDWHHFDFISDGMTLTIKEDGTKVGSGGQSGTPDMIKIGDMFNPFRSPGEQPTTMPAGQQSELWVKDVSFRALQAAPNNEVTEATTTSFSPLPHQISDVNVQDSDSALYCVMGDTVHLAGTTSGQHRLSRRSLTIDGQPYNDLPANPNEDGYHFDWKPNAPGSHKVAVRFTLQQPFAVLPVKDVTVDVLPKAPLALQQFTKPVPASCPVAVQPVDTTLFQPARVEFFLNDQSVGSADKAPFQVILPISKQAPGTYNVSYQAYDAQGARLSGESETVTVPVRVQLAMPSTINLVSDKDTVSFKSNIVPDLKVVRVDYSVDDQRVASTTAAPYEATANLSSLKSGSHSIKSEVVTEDGETFSAPTMTISLTNRFDDDRLARLAKEEADQQAILQKEEEAKQAKLAKQVGDAASAKAEQDHVTKEINANLFCFWPRPGFDEKVFRRQAAELAYYVPETRSGEVGIVHGMSVLTETEDGEVVSEVGKPLTVSAVVRPETGQTNFLAFSEADSKVTAQQAAEYCKTKTSAFHWDWSKYDLTVGYLENDVINGGPSAGSADALAMMSAILNIRVDTSVAFTGAITLQGQVEPVGGVGLKAKSAFKNTNAHTVIFPPDDVSIADLFQLYITNPILCFHRRVVMVKTMDDVMEQGLIGWNTDSEVREEKLVQGGLRHFARGEDKQALAAFAAAKAITPGNWTVDFWTSMVYAVEKQHDEDASAANGN